MQDHSPQNPDALIRRRRLGFVMALLISGVVFGPWTFSLFREGSLFFLVIVALIWLAVGRFFYQLLTPANGSARPPRGDTDQ